MALIAVDVADHPHEPRSAERQALKIQVRAVMSAKMGALD
jgi:hypothetical protein